MAFEHKRASRSDDGAAFLPDPSDMRGPPSAKNDGDSFAEEFLASATGGESVEMDAQDESIDEELGGPYLVIDPSADDADPDGLPPTRRFRKSGSHASS